MQDMRVAAVSTRNWVGEPDRAIRNMARWSEQAAGQGAEFILFPELCLNGYFWSEHALGFAEPIPGPSTDKMVALAARLNVILCFGMLENDNDVVYNTQVVVNGGGVLGTQRKIHMPGREYLYWRSGFEIDSIDIGKARLGIAICADALFMEMIRSLYFRGAEILVMPFAYNTKDRSKLPETDVGVMTYRVNCSSNGCFGVIANNAGSRYRKDVDPERMRFPGWAGVFDPSGEVLAWTRQKGTGESMVLANLEAKKLYDRRRSMYFVPRLLMPERYVGIGDATGANGHWHGLRFADYTPTAR